MLARPVAVLVASLLLVPSLFCGCGGEPESEPSVGGRAPAAAEGEDPGLSAAAAEAGESPEE
ncbi:MAG: hypothetical protein AAF907_09240 [Planctomycetota bacterium]